MEMCNLDNGLYYFVYAGKKGEPDDVRALSGSCAPTLFDVDLEYFMGLASPLKVIPVRSEQGTWEGSKVDIVFVDVNGSKARFMLDPKTHLPRVLTTYGWVNEIRFPNGRIIAAHEASLSVEFADYKETGGVLLPRKRRDSPGGWLLFEHLVDVDHSPAVFQQAPKSADGPEAWKKR
jgi:hypothetical protein